MSFFHGTGAPEEHYTPLHSFFLYPKGTPLPHPAWDTHSADRFCSHHSAAGAPNSKGVVRYTCLGHTYMHHGTDAAEGSTPAHSFFQHPDGPTLPRGPYNTLNADHFCSNHSDGEGKGIVRFTCLGHKPRYHGTGTSEEHHSPLHSFYLYPQGAALPHPAWDTHSVEHYCSHHTPGEAPSSNGIVRFTCLGHLPPPPSQPSLILCVSGSGSSTYVAQQRKHCQQVLDADEAQHVLFAPSGAPHGWWLRDSDEDLRITLRNLRCTLADSSAPVRVGAYSASTLLAGAHAGLLPPALTAFVRVPLAEHAQHVQSRPEREDPTFKSWPTVACSRRGMVREALRAGLPVHASFSDAAARARRVCARWDCDAELSRMQGGCAHARGPFCQQHCAGTGATCQYHAAKGVPASCSPGAVLLPPLPCAPARGTPASYLYFPGTLNPVHAGHLAVLEEVAQHYRQHMQGHCQGRPLAAAFLVPGPSAWAEGKGGPVPTVPQRLQLCELATDGRPWLAVDCAVAEGVVPGRVDAVGEGNPLAHLRARILASYGDAHPYIFLPLGSDAFLRQPPEALAFMAHTCGVAFIVSTRGGDRQSLGAHQAAVAARAEVVRAALGSKADHLTILPAQHKAWCLDSGSGRSSTACRQARTAWQLRSELGIPAVARYIEAEGLYGQPAQALAQLLQLLPPPTPLAAKKGLGLSDKNESKHFLAKASALRPPWVYTWGPRQPHALPPGVSFTPMVWGWWGQKQDLPPLTLTPQQAAAAPCGGALLGFNEPDGKDQANMSVEAALDAWPLLMNTGRRLGSPGCVQPEGQWMQEFMRGVEARGLRVDFVCMHYYRHDSADDLVACIKRVHQAYRRPVWLTEFAVADWKAEREGRPNRYSPERVMAFMTEALPKLQALDCLERYAWFTDDGTSVALGTSALLDAQGNLTPLGEFYRDFQ